MLNDPNCSIPSQSLTFFYHYISEIQQALSEGLHLITSALAVPPEALPAPSQKLLTQSYALLSSISFRTSFYLRESPPKASQDAFMKIASAEHRPLWSSCQRPTVREFTQQREERMRNPGEIDEDRQKPQLRSKTLQKQVSIPMTHEENTSNYDLYTQKNSYKKLHTYVMFVPS